MDWEFACQAMVKMWFSAQEGYETPLELLLTGGSLSDCAEHNECKADMSVNGFCGEIKEVVEEKSDIFYGTYANATFKRLWNAFEITSYRWFFE